MNINAFFWFNLNLFTMENYLSSSTVNIQSQNMQNQHDQKRFLFAKDEMR